MGYKLRPSQLRHLLVGIRNRHAAKLLDELQRGDQRVVFQGAAKDSEFDGAKIGEVDARVAPRAGGFCAVQHLLGAVLSAIASRPLLQLPFGTAGESQQLVPVVFHEEENAGDGFLLLTFRFAETVPVDMDVEPTGFRLVAVIALGQRFFHHSRPGHLIFMVIQRHGVGDDFHPFVQRAVMLNVDVLRVSVANAHQRLCHGVPFTAVVDLPLHAQIAGIFAIENRGGLVVVGLDAPAVAVNAIAAVGNVAVVVHVVRIIVVNQAAAVRTAVVVLVVAVLTKRGVGIALAVVGPDPLATAVADGGQFLKACLAQALFVEKGLCFNGKFRAAAVTGKGLHHFNFLHNYKMRPREAIPEPLHL